MTQVSRFWDGTTIGDATVAPYDAATEFAEVMVAIANTANDASKGGVVRSTLGLLTQTQPSGNVVRISPGEALVHGTWWRSDANVDFTVATPSTATRIDRIVLRKTWATQVVRLVVLAGSEGGSAPSMTRTSGTTWEIPVCQYSVTTLGVVTVTDQRLLLGQSDTGLTFVDPLVRDTLFFGAEPSGSADASIRRSAAGRLTLDTGELTAQQYHADGTTAVQRGYIIETAGSIRWLWGVAGGISEPGGNVGTDIGLYRYTDAGAYIGGVFGVNRASGTVQFGTLATFSANFSNSNWAHNIEASVWVVRQPSSAAVMTCDLSGNFNSAGSQTGTQHIASFGGFVLAHTGVGLQKTGAAGDITIHNTVGNIIVNPSSAYFYPVNNTVNNGHPASPWNNIYSSGALIFSGSVGAINSSQNIQIAPSAGYMHPDGHLTRFLGHPSISWSEVWAANHRAPGTIQLLAGGNGDAVLEKAGGGSAYIRGGYVYINGTATLGMIPEAGNGVLHLGDNAHKWIDVYANNGSIQTSSETVKSGFTQLRKGEALDALRLVKFGRFAYNHFPGATDESDPSSAISRYQVGYLAEDTARDTGDLFVLRDGFHVTPQQTASTIGAAVQDLDYYLRERLAELEDKVVELEARLTKRKVAA